MGKAITVTTTVFRAFQDVSEGSSETVPLRETDGRLEPLIATLIALGTVALVLTAVYWFATRPRQPAAVPAELTEQPDPTPKGSQ